MTTRPAHMQRRHHRLWLSLLGMTLVFLASCSSSPNGQTPTIFPTLTAIPGTGAVTPTAATSTTVDWSALEKQPLHLSALAPGASCPVTSARQQITPDHQYAAGNGPIYLVSSAITNPVIFLAAGSSDPGSPWRISKLFWEVAAAYSGPALIRGGPVDGTHALGFNGGLGQTAGNSQGTEPVLRELRLLGDPHGQWKTYLSFVRVQTPGCYAFQIDGQGFSESIIIQAAVAVQ